MTFKSKYRTIIYRHENQRVQANFYWLESVYFHQRLMIVTEKNLWKSCIMKRLTTLVINFMNFQLYNSFYFCWELDSLLCYYRNYSCNLLIFLTTGIMMALYDNLIKATKKYKPFLSSNVVEDFPIIFLLYLYI